MDWLEELSEERRRKSPSFAASEERARRTPSGYVIERMTDEEGRILETPTVVANVELPPEEE